MTINDHIDADFFAGDLDTRIRTGSIHAEMGNSDDHIHLIPISATIFLASSSRIGEDQAWTLFACVVGRLWCSQAEQADLDSGGFLNITYGSNNLLFRSRNEHSRLESESEPHMI